jgi:hypothetical protein
MWRQVVRRKENNEVQEGLEAASCHVHCTLHEEMKSAAFQEKLVLATSTYEKSWKNFRQPARPALLTSGAKLAGLFWVQKKEIRAIVSGGIHFRSNSVSVLSSLSS